MTLTLLLAIAIGTVAGLTIQRLVGCRSGACPIWATPVRAGLYGALLGFLIGSGS